LTKPDNTEASFKCQLCGTMFSRGKEKIKGCPQCGYTCSVDTCPTLGASNEDY